MQKELEGTERVMVADAGLLAQVVLETMQKEHRTQSQAAAALGISQGHYSKLIHGKVGPSISRPLYQMLCEKTSEEGQADLRRAILEPTAREALDKFLEWVTTEMRPLGIETDAKFEQVFDAPLADHSDLKPACPELAEDDDSGLAPVTVWEMEHEYDGLNHIDRRNEYHEIWMYLWETEPYAALFQRHWLRWHRRGHYKYRIELAQVRVLLPLLANKDTGGVERHWWELHETGELLTYTKAALKKEDILLARPPEVPRAQQQRGNVQ